MLMLTKEIARDRRWHLNAVMAWGYSLVEAHALCVRENWFGDCRAIDGTEGYRSK